MDNPGDISNTSGQEKSDHRRQGYLNGAVVKAITFYIISGCVIASVLLSILAIWEFADPDVFWRMIATFVVIGFGSAVFAVVNFLFGKKL